MATISLTQAQTAFRAPMMPFAPVPPCIWIGALDQCGPWGICSMQPQPQDKIRQLSCRLEPHVYDHTPLNTQWKDNTITWNTRKEVKDSQVWLSIDGASSTFQLWNKTEITTKVTKLTQKDTIGFEYKAKLSGLDRHVNYWYKVGSRSNPLYQSLQPKSMAQFN